MSFRQKVYVDAPHNHKGGVNRAFRSDDVPLGKIAANRGAKTHVGIQNKDCVQSKDLVRDYAVGTFGDRGAPGSLAVLQFILSFDELFA